MTVVLQMEPLWGNAATVAALYGIPRNRLLELAKSGHIRARKLSPDSRSATIVFRTADVQDWLENEAPKPRAEAFEPRRGVGAVVGRIPEEDEGGGGTVLVAMPDGMADAPARGRCARAFPGASPAAGLPAEKSECALPPCAPLLKECPSTLTLAAQPDSLGGSGAGGTVEKGNTGGLFERLLRYGKEKKSPNTHG